MQVNHTLLVIFLIDILHLAIVVANRHSYIYLFNFHLSIIKILLLGTTSKVLSVSFLFPRDLSHAFQPIVIIIILVRTYLGMPSDSSFTQFSNIGIRKIQCCTDHLLNPFLSVIGHPCSIGHSLLFLSLN